MTTQEKVGYSESTLFLLPLLGRRPAEIPFYVDCHTKKTSFIRENPHMKGTPMDDGRTITYIVILTETGPLSGTDDLGMSRLHKWFKQWQNGQLNPYFKTHIPNPKFYEWYVNIPGKFKKDFDNIAYGYFDKVSTDYLKAFKGLYPEYNYSDLATKCLDRLKQQYDFTNDL